MGHHEDYERTGWLPCFVHWFRCLALSATVACSLEPSTLSLASTPTKATRACSERCQHSQRHRLPSRSVLEQPTHSTQSVVVCRCSPKSPLRSTSTRELVIASRRLLPRKVWRLGFTRDSWQMFSEASAAPLCSCSTTGRRPTSTSEIVWDAAGDRFRDMASCCDRGVVT